jgi:hypothetical protein
MRASQVLSVALGSLLMSCGTLSPYAVYLPGDTGGDTGLQTSVSGDADADADADTDTDVDTDVDTDADADTDTDPTGGGGGVLLLSEVCDFADDSDVKFVEIHNPSASPVTLTGWVVKRYSNGSTLAAEYPLPDEDLPSGGYFVIANNAPDAFTAAFARDANAYSPVINGNGNDAYELVNGSSIVDVYGEVGVNGDGTSWFYEDSVALRSPGVSTGRASWDASEWTISIGVGSASPGL